MAEKKYLSDLYFYAPPIQVKVDSIEELEELMKKKRRYVFAKVSISDFRAISTGLRRNPAHKKE